jgi:hypothetical protein
VNGIDGPDAAHGPAVLNPDGGGTVPQFSNTGTWADETDIRPTMLSLVGLKDDYATDGRVISEILDRVAPALRGTEALGACYKQLNAGVGDFATNTLIAETSALAGGSAADDSQFTDTQSRLQALSAVRDVVATGIKTTLSRAAFDGIRPAPITSAVELIACRAVIGASLITSQ